MIRRELAVLLAAALAAKGLVGKGSIFAIQDIDVIASVSITKVHIITRRWRHCKPGWLVWGAWVLAKIAVALPNDRAVKQSLRQLLVVVCMVQVFPLRERIAVPLGGDGQPMRRTRTQRRIPAQHVLTSGTIRLPANQTAVRIKIVIILIGEVDVVIGVQHKTMAVDHYRPIGWLEAIRNVFVAVLPVYVRLMSTKKERAALLVLVGKKGARGRKGGAGKRQDAASP